MKRLNLAFQSCPPVVAHRFTTAALALSLLVKLGANGTFSAGHMIRLQQTWNQISGIDSAASLSDYNPTPPPKGILGTKTRKRDKCRGEKNNKKNGKASFTSKRQTQCSHRRSMSFLIPMSEMSVFQMQGGWTWTEPVLGGLMMGLKEPVTVSPKGTDDSVETGRAEAEVIPATCVNTTGNHFYLQHNMQSSLEDDSNLAYRIATIKQRRECSCKYQKCRSDE